MARTEIPLLRESEPFVARLMSAAGAFRQLRYFMHRRVNWSYSFYTAQAYPGQLRRVRYKDALTGKSLVFLTNHFGIPALSVCALYKSCWQVELFFKWLKQHLRIKRFFGTSENAVKSQVWVAVATYVLVAIFRKRLKLELSLHTMLQVLSVTPFEKIPLIQLFSDIEESPNMPRDANQLILL